MAKSYLKERRKDLGLTLKQVADAVGVSEGTVSRRETGNIDNMRQDKIIKVAEVLHASPLWVIGIDIENSHIEFHKKLLELSRDYLDLSKNFFGEALIAKETICAESKVLEELTGLSPSQYDDIRRYIIFIKTQTK